jgi:hypothetical protein
LTGAVRADEVLGLVRLVRNRRKPPPATEPTAAEAHAA